MIDYYPILAEKSLKDKLLNYEIQFFESEIRQTEARILSISSQPKNPTFKRLHSEQFWQALESDLNHKDSVLEIKSIWHKVQPFAHLNTKELLSLLYDDVISLERYYQLALKAYDNEKGVMNTNDAWPWNWIYPSYEQKISRIKESQERLVRLKSVIHTGLFWRCQVHSLLNTTRETDDIVAALSIKLNNLSILKEPLQVNISYSTTLTDDRRVAIYDHLEASWPNKDELHNKVIAPIPKQGHIAFKSAQEVQQELKDMRKFNKRTYQTLNPQSNITSTISSYVSSFTPDIVKKSLKYGLDGLKDFLTYIGFLDVLSNFWGLRYIAYFILSFFCYNYLLLAIKPMVSVALGVTGFAILDTILFYGIALAPTWVLSYVFFASVKQFLFNVFSRRKKTDIYHSLEALLSSQEAISNQLSQVIIDLSRYEIDTLSDKVQFFTTKFNQLKINLSRFNTIERILCKGDINLQIKSVRDKIVSQETLLKTRLGQLATHIAQRIGEDIELLEKSPTTEQLSSIIPHEQVNKLRTFVMIYGDEASLKLFNENASPIHKWVSKFDKFTYPQQTIENSLNQPWGGHVVREDYLKGWETILKGYLPKGSQRDAALNINNLLLGKITATPEFMQEWINQLALGDESAIALHKIQAHLFKTLRSEILQNAKLVDESHQELINDWHKSQQSEVAQAKTIVRNTLKTRHRKIVAEETDKLSDEQLGRIYQLFDAENIHENASNQTMEQNPEQLARQYFQFYQGETSRAIRLLRFIPTHETENLIVDVARKRLSWLLSNLGKGVDSKKPFDDTDTELFLDFQVMCAADGFDFNTHILTSKEFNAPWDPNMESFLEACALNSFDSGKLSKTYKENNTQIKPFIISKQRSSCAHIEETQVNPSSISKSRKRRGVRA